MDLIRCGTWGILFAYCMFLVGLPMFVSSIQESRGFCSVKRMQLIACCQVTCPTIVLWFKAVIYTVSVLLLCCHWNTFNLNKSSRLALLWTKWGTVSHSGCQLLPVLMRPLWHIYCSCTKHVSLNILRCFTIGFCSSMILKKKLHIFNWVPFNRET